MNGGGHTLDLDRCFWSAHGLLFRDGQGSRHCLDPDDTENNYLLFAVMVHAGSAYGGHYYAFLKSISKEGKVWICAAVHLGVLGFRLLVLVRPSHCRDHPFQVLFSHFRQFDSRMSPPTPSRWQCTRHSFGGPKEGIDSCEQRLIHGHWQLRTHNYSSTPSPVRHVQLWVASYVMERCVILMHIFHNFFGFAFSSFTSHCRPHCCSRPFG